MSNQTTDPAHIAEWVSGLIAGADGMPRDDSKDEAWLRGYEEGIKPKSGKKFKYIPQTLCFAILTLLAGINGDIAAFHENIPVELGSAAVCVMLITIAIATFWWGIPERLRGKKKRKESQDND